jgi:hypothetical protein
MVWDTTDPHGWLCSRVWFTCISQFRNYICKKQDVLNCTHVIWFFSMYIAVFTSCHFFFGHVCPRRTIATGHWMAHILYRDHIQEIVSPVDTLVSGRSLLRQNRGRNLSDCNIHFFPVVAKKKKIDSPDWDVNRLKCPPFCPLNLISVCRVNLRCLGGTKWVQYWGPKKEKLQKVVINVMKIFMVYSLHLRS